MMLYVTTWSNTRPYQYWVDNARARAHNRAMPTADRQLAHFLAEAASRTLSPADSARMLRILRKQVYMEEGMQFPPALAALELTKRRVAGMLVAQNGYCAACAADLASDTVRRWCVDTIADRVRGVVCAACATRMRNVRRLKCLADYLQKHGDWPI